MLGLRCKISFSKLSTKCDSYPVELNTLIFSRDRNPLGELFVEFSSIDVASGSSSFSSDDDFFGLSLSFILRARARSIDRLLRSVGDILLLRPRLSNVYAIEADPFEL